MMTLLDGPVGTRLSALGVPTPAPLWSAAAIRGAPGVLARVHHDYADAGATVHTAATFRTRPDDAGPAWRALMSEAVRIARGAVPAGHRIAGSVGPIADCWRPDLTPPDASARHRAFAEALAPEVDILLCETFANVGEGLDAARACLATGRETWVSFTAGFNGDLLTPGQVGVAGAAAARLGASVVLVNCTPARESLAFVRALAGCGRVGVYANTDVDPSEYADLAQSWVEAGATVLGACCGGGPEHIAALAHRFQGAGRQTTPGP